MVCDHRLSFHPGKLFSVRCQRTSLLIKQDVTGSLFPFLLILPADAPSATASETGKYVHAYLETRRAYLLDHAQTFDRIFYERPVSEI